MDILGLGKAIDLVRDVLGPIGGAASEAWAGLIGDRVAYWRIRNAMQYQPIIHEEAARLGLKLNPARIPEKYAFAWFEAASKQDEPEIQVLFARLLARAADETAEVDTDRRLIAVLSEFTPEDAALFQRLYSDFPFPDAGAYSTWKGIGSVGSRGYPADWLASLLGRKDNPDVEISLESLTRLGCLDRYERFEFKRGSKVQIKIPQGWSGKSAVPFDIDKELRDRTAPRVYYIATKLGQRLYEAVKE